MYWVAAARSSLLLVSLEGSVIFVFDGGEVFPDLIMVLLGHSWARGFVGSRQECSRAWFLVLPWKHWGQVCQLCAKCANFVTSALDPLKTNVCSLHCSMMALKVDQHRFVLMRFRRDRIGVV